MDLGLQGQQFKMKDGINIINNLWKPDELDVLVE